MTPSLVVDADVEVGRQDQNPLALVPAAHADVVQLGAKAQGEATRRVHAVATDLGVGQQRLPVDFDGALGLVECPRRLKTAAWARSAAGWI